MSLLSRIVQPTAVTLTVTEIKTENMGSFYCSGMQDFNFTETYDVIWIQWVIGHLHDADLVNFLLKCKSALSPGGLICIKDNVSCTFRFSSSYFHIFTVEWSLYGTFISLMTNIHVKMVLY